VRRIAADAWKILKLSDVSWELTLETVCNRTGEMSQSEGAIIISHALPCAYDIRRLGTGELFKSGKTLEKGWIFQQNSAHLGLLEHNL
jgi:hypothetical protein